MRDHCGEHGEAGSLSLDETSDETLRQELSQVRRQLTMAIDRSGDLVRRAIDAEAARKQFIARISFQMRTPLNTIVGFSRLLAEETLPSQQRQYVDAIHYSAEQLLDLLVASMAEPLDSEAQAATPLPC